TNWTSTNPVIMAFNAELTGGWEFSAYNVKKLVAGLGTVFSLSGSVTDINGDFVGDSVSGSNTDTNDGSFNPGVSTSFITGEIVHWNAGSGRIFESFNISFSITNNNAAVPEPGTMAVFGLLGIGGAVSRIRRKK
ncbi:MAG: PEP-CTERM sorting domain-containing protein, partial [Pirellula sp.]